MSSVDEFIRLFECWEEGLSYKDFYIDVNNALEDAKASKPLIDPAHLDRYLTESLTEKLNEIEYGLGLDYTDTEGHIVVTRHRKGRPDLVVLSQSFLVPRPPDIDELEQENKLLRARNERLEKEMLSYTVGWNNALDASAARLVHYFKGAFGDDTCASWALWLKSQRLPEDSK